MKYRVRGVVRSSGKIFDKEAEAPSEEVLRERAEAKGITVVAIDLVASAPEETIELEPLEEPGQKRRVLQEPQAEIAAEPAHAPSPVLKLQPEPAPIPSAPPVAPSQGARTLGAVALLLGVVALITWWVPSVGALSVPVAVLGLLIGLFALVVAFVRRGRGVVMAFAGSVVCGLAMVGGLGHVEAIKSYIGEVKSRFAAPQQPLAETAEPIPAPSTASKPATAPKPAAVAKLGEAIRNGDVEIVVDEARVAQAQFVTQAGAPSALSEKPMLLLTWTVNNASKTKKFFYVSPSDSGALQVIDNFDNSYSGRRANYARRIKGSVFNKELYPGESVQDVVGFERLVDGVTHFDVIIPGQVIGQRLDIRLRVMATELTVE